MKAERGAIERWNAEQESASHQVAAASMASSELVAPRTAAMRAIVAVVLLIAYGWALSRLGLSSERLAAGWDMFKRVVTAASVPDWAYLPRVWEGLRESLHIAVLATTAAAVMAFPFGLIAAEHPHIRTFLSPLAKGGLGAIRTFPEILFAILFMRAVGPGPYAGVLALSVYSVGFMGKFYAQIMEEVPAGPAEALRAAGAGRLAVIRHALLPYALPGFLSLVLYRFEQNVRVATVLGIVGAGGIGQQLMLSLTSRSWNRVIVIILVLIAAISLIDALSGWARHRISQGLTGSETSSSTEH